MDCISTSVFELFKIGPGPSSSHTIGPMAAGNDFASQAASLPEEVQARADGILVRLFGSLSATGRGHGTDRAVLAGLLGQRPESCPPDFLDGIQKTPDAPRPFRLAGRSLPLRLADIRFESGGPPPPHPNTLTIALTAGERVLFEREYYSVGGGSIDWKGSRPSPQAEPIYEYSDMAGLLRLLDQYSLRLPELMLANETAISGRSEAQVAEGLDRILAAMDLAVTRGLADQGRLPGGIGLERKARTIMEASRSDRRRGDKLIATLAACAFAAAEENAAGHVIVTAPTCGSSGVIPAVARVIRSGFRLRRRALREGLLAAAAIGFLVKHNATIAGAEGGCQAEIGVAAGMAAAMLAQAHGNDARTVEHAAEIALEHHLGLTCDPVGGFVQIPCIERNAMGAVKAYAAWRIAAATPATMHKVGLDQAVAAMLATGRDMCARYKETAQGGLAAVWTTC